MKVCPTCGAQYEDARNNCQRDGAALRRLLSVRAGPGQEEEDSAAKATLAQAPDTVPSAQPSTPSPASALKTAPKLPASAPPPAGAPLELVQARPQRVHRPSPAERLGAGPGVVPVPGAGPGPVPGAGPGPVPGAGPGPVPGAGPGPGPARAPAPGPAPAPAAVGLAAAPTTTAPASIGPGSLLGGRYKLKKLIGQGGMGDVFEAEDTKIEKRVAVKLLKRQYSLKKDIVVRFRREALSSARIGHANIIDVTDLDQTPDGHLYLVMEFLAGSSLSRVLRRNGRMTLDTAVRVFRQIAAALQAAHDKGIIHRDLKPGNIFILDKGASDQNFVKVLDFGIAFIKDEAGTEARLTRAGAILGTPDYMSPEQARGDDLDQRADIYSAGVILYEMLAGAPPFQADTYMGVINKHMYEEPPRLTERVPDLHLPPKFEDALRRSLAKAADERFGSMDEFMDALEDALRLHGASTGKFPSLQTPKASVAGPATEVDGTPRAGRRGSSPSLTPAAMEAVAGPARARAARMPRWVPPLGAAVALVCGTLGALAIYERRGDSAADGQEDEPGARRAGTGGGAAGAEDGDGSRTAAAPDADRAASAGAGASPSATPTAGTAAAPVTAAPYALFTPDFGTAGAKRPATGAPGHAPVPGRTASVVPDTHAPGTHAPVTVADGIEVKKATVQFESAPAGVVVMEGLKSICITPCFGSFDDPRKARTIEFVRAGFKTVTRTFSPLTETTMKVTLEPTTAVKPETAAPKPAGILTPDLP